MFTLVIDIHGGLAGFETALPFLYPLNGLVRFIELTEHKFTKIGEAAAEVRRFLERGHSRQWQAVFLVDLALRHPNPFVGSLTYYLYSIKEKFLAPLEHADLAPEDIIVLAVDMVERDLKGKPLDPELAIRWKLDTRGIRDDAGAPDYTFTTAEIAELDSLWGGKPDVKNEKFGRGLEGLSPGLQEELRTRKQKLETGINQLLEKKDRLLAESAMVDTVGQDDPINTFLRKSWENIKIEFLERTGQILIQNPDSAAAIENFRPAEILADVIKNNIGIHSEYFGRQFSVIRCPFRLTHPRDFQLRVLELTFLLVAIAENHLGSTFRRYKTHQVEILTDSDDHQNREFARLLADYKKCLEINLENLKEKITLPGPVHVSLLTESTQKCNEELAKEQIHPVAFDFFLDNDAIPRLREWKTGISAAIATTDSQRRKAMVRCTGQNRLTRAVENNEEIVDIREKVRELEEEYASRLKQLPHDDIPGPGIDGVGPFMDRKEWELQAELGRRPTRNQFLLTAGITFLVLFLSIFFNVKRAGEILFWGALAAAAAAAAGLLSRRHFFRLISRLVREVTANAEEIIVRIQQQFERQKNLLLKLVNVNIARKNVLEARKAMEKTKESKERLNYHLEELACHLERANRLCGLFPLEDDNYAGLTGKDFVSLDLNASVTQNRVYSPATFRENPSKHEYRLGIDGGYRVRSGYYLFAVDRIEFKRDKVYPGGD